MANMYSKIHIDETIRESVSHGNEKYPFAFYLDDIWEFDFHCADWHWHPELEFVYAKKGEVTASVGNSKFVLSPGNGVFINKQVVHRFESSESTITPNIVFSPHLLVPKESLIFEKYIQPILSSSMDYQIFSPDVSWQKEVLDILNTIFELQEKEDSCELQTVQLLLKIWNILYSNTNTMHIDSSSKTDIQEQARLQIMLQYIHENYQNCITLENLTQEISLSKSTVLNIFHKYVQMSPIDYAIHYKMKQAALLLETTENTVLSIAQTIGFDNVGYFCRKFKEIFKVTPSQYRKSKIYNI